MKTIRERILGYLLRHPEGADDDELTEALNLKYRQQANSRCRRLETEGVVERRVVDGKIRNFLIDVEAAHAILRAQPKPAEERPWFWEGNVQHAVAEYLRSQGYIIRRMADTARYQTGKDIEAESEAGPLWVTVKGYPKGTSRTHPSTQAGHWFKGALFDIIVWRGEDPNAELAIALPDYPRYRGLVEKVGWLQTAVPFFCIWIREDGTVSVERGS